MAELMRGTPLRRFEDKYITEPNTGCWIWVGALNSDGYASLRIGNKIEKAHIWFFKLVHKIQKIEHGLEADHLCRLRCCVNPRHLEVVTKRINILRGFGAAALCARKTHCVRGHPLTGNNIITNKHHPRMCRACHNIHGKAYRQKKANK
jgi:hypothetical protein